MAIKSKSKIALVALLLLFSFGLNGVLSALFNTAQQEYLKGSYFQTTQFNNQLNQFVDYLGIFELDKVTAEDAKKAITVTDADIEEYRNRYGNLQMQLADIRGQYEPRIQAAVTQRNQQLADALTAERDKKLDDITKNHTSDDYVREKVIKEKEQQIDEDFRQRENLRPDYLQLKAAFKYYVKDISNGTVYTNLDQTGGLSADQQLSANNAYVVRDFPATLPENGYNYTNSHPPTQYNGFSVTRSAVAVPAVPNKTLGPFEGKIAVLQSAPATSQVMTNYYDFKRNQTVILLYTALSIISLLISVIVIRRTGLMQSITLQQWDSYFNRIPLDILSAIFAVGAFVTFVFLVNSHPGYYARVISLVDDFLTNLCISALLIAGTYISGRLLFNRLQNIPNLQADWHKTVIYRMVQGIQAAFMNRSSAVQIFLILVIMFCWGGGTFILADHQALLIPYMLAVLFIGMPTVIILIRRVGYFNRIVKYTTELAAGNYQAELPIDGKSALADLAGSLNKLKSGVKVSQREQAKSERLKTELITNVSHDLRTPLTSVITYTELLKNPELSDEDREAYIQIIDRKSKRLKVLIDDLFEASKMASGNIELDTKKADLVQLLQQTLAEHNAEISKSTLQFRVKTPETPVFAIVDGQRLWRVFDNVIGNVLKYALENTRVHITMETVDDRAIISFKNVTKYELSENVDELFERFKRGDTSRHTDGSGLGLAIAKSIVDLHGGSMDIEVDGDLFKVTVTLQRIV